MIRKLYMLCVCSFALCCSSFDAKAQSSFGRNFTDSLPDEYIIDFTRLRDHIYNGMPESFKTEDKKRVNYLFASQQANALRDYISSGNVYSDWPEMENFLNEMLEKIRPKELDNEPFLHAYITREGFYNAFMTGSGHMFINVGVFNDIQDEASLAAVMCHEMAHYYKRHSLQSFTKKINREFWYGLVKDEKAELEFSQSLEAEADSLAIIWMNNSPYSKDGIVSSLKLLDKLSKRGIKKHPEKWEFQATSHPLSGDRLAMLNRHYENLSSTSTAKFVVGEEAFKKLKHEAQVEILSFHLHEINYKTCIETAFKFHLFEPDNAVYIYYLMEAIRRQCYLYPEDWSKNFIASNFFEDKEREGQVNKVPYSKHLFEKFDMVILNMSPEEARNVKARFYWQNDPKFKTNEEAFEFFNKLGNALNCTECILSNALSITKNDANRKVLLEAYLQKSDAQYKSFARKMIDNSFVGSLPNKKMLVMKNFRGYIRQGKEDVPLVFSEYDKLVEFPKALAPVQATYPQIMVVNNFELKRYQLNEYFILDELATISGYILKAPEPIKVHIIDPRYAAFFEEKGVNQIDFYYVNYGEFRKSEKSLEAYEEALSMTLGDLYQQKDRTRNLQIYVTSLREKKNKWPLTRYYSDEMPFKFGSEALPEIIEILKAAVIDQEKSTAEHDARINYYNSRQ